MPCICNQVKPLYSCSSFAFDPFLLKVSFILSYENVVISSHKIMSFLFGLIHLCSTFTHFNSCIFKVPTYIITN